MNSFSNAPRTKAFNWGAFFLTWIWALGNRCFDTVTLILLALCFVPYIGVFSAVFLAIYSGITGDARALKSRPWQSAEHFERVQRRWAVAGAIQFGFAILLLTVLPTFYDR